MCYYIDSYQVQIYIDRKLFYGDSSSIQLQINNQMKETQNEKVFSLCYCL